MENGNQVFVECTNCGARNRVPPERAKVQAKCGRCHSPLPAAGGNDGGASYVLRCSDCGAKNRVSSSRMSEHPKCGKCGAALRAQELFEPQLFTVSDLNFGEKVLKSPLPVLVFAMSSTCPGCTMVAPHIDAFARAYAGKVKVGRLNIQHSPGLASRLDIMSVPHLLIFDKGNLLQSLPGGLDQRQLRDLMTPYLY
jgi:thiol-disulfide isomerase/thioredoxin